MGISTGHSGLGIVELEEQSKKMKAERVVPPEAFYLEINPAKYLTVRTS